jgi:hypothetical protein
MHARFPALAASVLLLLSCSGAKAPPIERDYALTQITDHVYVIHGPNENPGRTIRVSPTTPASCSFAAVWW